MYHKHKGKKPSYKYSDFRKACKNKNNIFINDAALKCASKYFNLRTQKQLLEFIYKNGPDSISFINTKPWEQNPDKSQSIMVDAYDFISGNKKGYLAFMYSKKTKKWVIKSFHLSKNMNDQMLQAIKKAGIVKKLTLGNQKED